MLHQNAKANTGLWRTHPRYTYPDKKNIRCGGSVLQFLWHFSSISARVLALSLFATAFPRWVGPVCAAHVLLMTTWILAQRVDACSTAGETLLFALVLGVVYIFSFFNAKEERTRSAIQSKNILLSLLNKSCNFGPSPCCDVVRATTDEQTRYLVNIRRY